MTGNQLKLELRRAGIGQIAAADKLGVNPAELRRWIANDSPIPDNVAECVRELPDRPTPAKSKPAKLRPDVAETAFRVIARGDRRSAEDTATQ